MKEFQAKTIINANAAEVWKVLLGAENHAHFDPTCERIAGEIKNGRTLKIFSKRPPKKSRCVQVTLIPERYTMVWHSKTPLCLMNRTKTFSVIAKDDHTSEFYLHERLSGLWPSLCSNLAPDLANDVEQEARGLKRLMEARP